MKITILCTDASHPVIPYLEEWKSKMNHAHDVEIIHTNDDISDGDILFHALSDALLGAAALGDIGCFFPDTDSKNKDIDSSLILSFVLNKILKLSYQILNIDVTIVLEKPKLQPIIPSIKKSVAESLKIKLDQVNIKATTSEGMGFVGKEEGVVCYVSVLLEKI